jgi:hypothetical protein
VKIKFKWSDSISLDINLKKSTALKRSIELRFPDDLKNLLDDSVEEVTVFFKKHKPMPTIDGTINDMSGKTLYSFKHYPLKNGDTDYTKHS